MFHRLAVLPHFTCHIQQSWSQKTKKISFPLGFTIILPPPPIVPATDVTWLPTPLQLNAAEPGQTAMSAYNACAALNGPTNWFYSTTPDRDMPTANLIHSQFPSNLYNLTIVFCFHFSASSTLDANKFLIPRFSLTSPANVATKTSGKDDWSQIATPDQQWIFRLQPKTPLSAACEQHTNWWLPWIAPWQETSSFSTTCHTSVIGL